MLCQQRFVKRHNALIQHVGVNKHVGVNFDEMAAVPGTRLSFSLIERYKFHRLY